MRFQSIRAVATDDESLKDYIVQVMTKSGMRKSLYHFTRLSNIPSIAHFDALFSPSLTGASSSIGPFPRRRQVRTYGGYTHTVNSHLNISDDVMSSNTSKEDFYACLDRHVFFWPTLRDCKKMLNMYQRREPEELFAVLQLDAYTLISSHFSSIKVSKYDSGSSPRFPHRCSYRKSTEMFLPLVRLGAEGNTLVPTKPSEVKEVLIEGEVRNISKYLQAVFSRPDKWPCNQWHSYIKDLSEIE